MSPPLPSPFDRRLAKHGPLAMPTAQLIETFLVRRRWQRRDNEDRSRLFLPPHYSTGEAGLRIHFESHGKKPALEFALKSLRNAREDEQAEWIHERLAKLVDYVPSPDFPSTPLETILPRWESGFRELVQRYAAARRRAP